MRDDELMDQLLKDAMAADAPRLSVGFDARVMQGVRPRRLTTMGRVAIAVYVLVASAATVWLMRDLSIELIAVGIAIAVPVAVGARAYGRRLAA